MGGVLRIPQVVQREVGRDDQRLAATVTAVYHIENPFQPVLGAVLHAEVVMDQQRIAANSLNLLLYSLSKYRLLSNLFITKIDVYKRQKGTNNEVWQQPPKNL